MNQLNFILLQAANNPDAGSGYPGFIMIIAMIVIFYFFMIRPQSKKQKEIKKAREAMKKGDKVVTAGGIHGKIKDLTDTTVMIEIAPGITIKVDKASVFADPNSGSAKKETKAESKDKKEADKESSDDESGKSLEEAAGKVSKK